MEEHKLLLLSSSPHIAHPVNSQVLMRRVLIALLPAAVFGIVMYGARAFFLIAVTVLTAELAESAFRLLTKRGARVRDLSAAVTGVLLALTLPPQIPLWMAALGAIFAVVVAKEFFGGLGANVFNPALGGRAFLLTSFPSALTSWISPDASATGIADTASTATPLAAMNLGVENPALETFIREGFAGGKAEASVIWRLLLGNYSGSLGETSALCIIAGGIFLVITKTIDVRTPASMIISAFLLSAALKLDPLYSILAGGLLFGAVFMATDYVTTPISGVGKVIFGAGCGIITVIIRKFGSYPEGVMYSILVMNAVSPFLDKFLHKKYGFVKKTKQKLPKNGGAL